MRVASVSLINSNLHDTFAINQGQNNFETYKALEKPCLEAKMSYNNTTIVTMNAHL